MFHRLSKHLEFRQKYSAARRIFNSLLRSVWISDETLFLVFDILREMLSSLYNKIYNITIILGHYVPLALVIYIWAECFRNLSEKTTFTYDGPYIYIACLYLLKQCGTIKDELLERSRQAN